MKRIFAEDEELVYYLHTLKWPERDIFGQLPPIPSKEKKVKDTGQRKVCGCMVSKILECIILVATSVCIVMQIPAKNVFFVIKKKHSDDSEKYNRVKFCKKNNY